MACWEKLRADMISRTDLYIEKLIAKMNLDDAQRVEVERELRAHLDEAVQSGAAAGLTEQQAEEEALLRFGQPSVLARQFGAVHGTGWLVFERLAAALLMYWALGRLVLPDSTPLWVKPCLQTVVAVVYFCAVVWNKVEVNGVLRVRRFLRPTVVIPFESIKSVSFPSGHVAGHRLVRIGHASGHTTVSSRLPNFRCAALAIDALAPHALPPGVESLTTKLRLQVRREGLLFRWAFTGLWVTVLACYVAGLPALWNMQGIPLLFALGGVAALAVISAQASQHVDRARRVTSSLLIVAWFAYVGWFMMSFAFWGEPQRRWVVIVFPVMVVLPILQLWWRWRRRDLLLTCVATLAGTYAMHSVIARSWPAAPARVVARTVLMNADVLSGDSPAYVGLGINREKSREGSAISYDLFRASLSGHSATSSLAPLPPGEWAFLGSLTSNTLLLATEHPTGSSTDETVSELYVTSATGDVRRLFQLPAQCALGVTTCLGLPFLSPNKSYVLTPVTSATQGLGGKPDRHWAIGITDMKSRALRRFDRFRADKAWRWLDDERLLAIDTRVESAHLDSGTTRTYEHEVWVLNARTGEVELQRRFVLGDGTRTFATWNSSRYANADDCIADLETGALTPIPLNASEKSHWQAATGTLACVTRDRDGQRLLVFDPRGLKAFSPLPATAKVDLVAVSPDGNRVLVIYQERPDLLLSSSSVALFDTSTGKLRVVERLPFFPSFLNIVVAGMPKSALQWTPDGEAIYPVFTIIRKGAKPAAGHELHVTGR